MRATSVASLRSLSMVTQKSLALIFLCVLSYTLAARCQQEDESLAAARSLIQNGKNQEAIAQLQVLAARHPGMKGINRELGVAYYREGGYLEASKYLQDAWRENPEDRDAAQLLGLSFYSIGRPIEAIPALEQVRRWYPNANMDAIYTLGLCYALTKNYPKALETFAELYGLPTESAAAHLLLARMLLRQGFDPVAESEARKALSLSPLLRVQGRLPESLAGIPRRTDHQPGLRSRSYAPGRRVLAPQPLRRSRDSLAALHVAGLYSFRALRNHGKGVSKKGTTGAGRANPAARHRHGPQ